MGMFDWLFGGAEKGTEQAAQTVAAVPPAPAFTDFPVAKKLEDVILGILKTVVDPSPVPTYSPT